MLPAYTSLLTDQALQILKFGDHGRSEEGRSLQQGILLSGNVQDGSEEPGTERQTQEPVSR